MSKEEWQNAYRAAWGLFYNNDHLEQVLRRAYASGIIIRSLMPVLFIFSTSVALEGVHPLQWGMFRIKDRRTRRSGLPIESPLVFYPRYAAEIARKAVVLAKRWYELKRIVRKIEADPLANSHMDEAMTPVSEEDFEHMELYTQNAAARSAVERELAWRTTRRSAKALMHTRTATPMVAMLEVAMQPPAPGMPATVTITARRSRQSRLQPSEPR